MEIPLFQDDETLRFERIVLYPYPDLTRIWTRCWITAVQDQHPNVEIRVLNPDGSENASVFLMSQAEQRIETTLHLREPAPGRIYRVIAELTIGLDDKPGILDAVEFELLLEFRNPDTLEPGFGIGVDWDDFRDQA